VTAPARDAGAERVDLPTARLELAAVSDRGTVRRENQDRWALRPLPQGCALVLADGMGGHADGAIAAHLAVEAAVGHLLAAADPGAALGGAVAAAAGAVAAHRRAHRGAMSGTTLVLAVVGGDTVRLANVGDSRGYRIRDGVAEQLTVDHSWIAEQVRDGRIDPGRAVHHPGRNMLTRALTGEPVDADLFSAGLVPGDVVLLCSDGVWDAVDDVRLADSISRGASLEDSVAELCDRALAAGSTDNVTVVACRMWSRDD
jgi:serine/threonine protein phosphatase PrpC